MKVFVAAMLLAATCKSHKQHDTSSGATTVSSFSTLSQAHNMSLGKCGPGKFKCHKKVCCDDNDTCCAGGYCCQTGYKTCCRQTSSCCGMSKPTCCGTSTEPSCCGKDEKCCRGPTDSNLCCDSDHKCYADDDINKCVLTKKECTGDASTFCPSEGANDAFCCAKDEECCLGPTSSNLCCDSDHKCYVDDLFEFNKCVLTKKECTGDAPTFCPSSGANDAFCCAKDEECCRGPTGSSLCCDSDHKCYASASVLNNRCVLTKKECTSGAPTFCPSSGANDAFCCANDEKCGTSSLAGKNKCLQAECQCGPDDPVCCPATDHFGAYCCRQNQTCGKATLISDPKCKGQDGISNPSYLIVGIFAALFILKP